MTADNVLRCGAGTVHVVPITSNTTRDLPTEVRLNESFPDRVSVAQVQLCTGISAARIIDAVRDAENIGSVPLAALRALLGGLLDLG